MNTNRKTDCTEFYGKTTGNTDTGAEFHANAELRAGTEYNKYLKRNQEAGKTGQQCTGKRYPDSGILKEYKKVNALSR